MIFVFNKNHTGHVGMWKVLKWKCKHVLKHRRWQGLDFVECTNKCGYKEII